MALPLRAQQASCAQRTVAVSFVDKDLLPIPGIAPADLEAKLHGKPLTILSVAPDQRPHPTVILLDSSGSMRDHWRAAIQIARQFVKENSGTSEMALINFGGKDPGTVGFSEGNSAVSARLHELASDPTNAQGMSAIRDAIARATQLFNGRSSANAIYLITDGGDNASKRSAAFVGQLLSARSVRLFVILLRDQPDEDPSFRLREITHGRELAEIAAASGGGALGYLKWNDNRLFFDSDSSAPVDLSRGQALARLFQAVSRDDVIQAQLPNPVYNAERFELKLGRDAHKRWEGARILSPRFLPACPAQ